MALLTLFLLACPPTDDSQPKGCEDDADGDGYGTSGFCSFAIDCDDSNPEVSPAEVETCDGIDNDCDSQVDEVAGTWYTDSDADGYGDPGTAVTGCQPDATIAIGGDCNDADPLISPGAAEICNADGQPVDENCNGDADDADSSLSAPPTWCQDGDGDGFGDDLRCTQRCLGPTGWVQENTDCNDDNPDINPGKPEICAEGDEDCNALEGMDDPGITDPTVWCSDEDGDHFGDPATCAPLCAKPSGATQDDTDCDDTDENINPRGTEICGGEDEDCNGLTDDEDSGVTETVTWCADADGDSFGDAAACAAACQGPTGSTTDQTDCNDASSDQYPGATELCGGVDLDCDGLIDEADPDSPLTTFYLDADGDGHGDPAAAVQACTLPTGASVLNDDCDDADPAAFPGGAEVCGGGDEDCDGLLNEDDPDAAPATWYDDLDTDGFGDAATATVACEAPPGATTQSGDCDDLEESTFPGAPEACDGVDHDCDSLVDDDDPDSPRGTWFADTDGDSFGDPSAALDACDAPPGYLADNTDCQDADATIRPGGTEVCFGADEDCDGLIDEADPDTQLSSWYADTDGDSFGNLGALSLACAAPIGTVADATDCNDGDNTINPAALEVCGGVDLDCDGLVDEQDPDTLLSDWYPDQDGDSLGDDAGLITACAGPPGSVSTGGDCRDTDPLVGTCTLYTLGNATDLGDFLTLSQTELHLQKLSLSSGATLLALGAIQDHAAGELILSLYSDAAGAPDQLLLATPPTLVQAGTQEIDVPATALTAGDYWVGAAWDTEVTVRSAAGTLPYGSTLYTWGDSLPSPITGITPAAGPDLNLYLVVY